MDIYPYNKVITCDYEIVNNDRCIPVSKKSLGKLKNFSLINEVRPFKTKIDTRCIQLLAHLPVEESQCCTIPVSVYNIQKSAISQKVAEKHKNIIKTENTYTKNLHKLPPENVVTDMAPEEFAKFYDKNLTISNGPNYDEGELDEDIIEPRGHYVPKDFNKKVEDIVDLSLYDEIQRSYIEKIFLKQYPQIVATGTLSIGNISATLGRYHIRLKDNEVLPYHKKIYFMCPSDTQHLKDILSWLEKYKVIEKAAISSDGAHLSGVPAYLISRNKPNSCARLLIDFRNLNQQIIADANIIPDITSLLHSLRNSAIYSSTDISNAYMNYTLTKESRPLTTFLTPLGSYYYNKLPQGLSVSCEVWSRVVNKMIHHKPVLDKSGSPIYEAKNMVKMEEDRIDSALIFFDDLLIHTPMELTYKLTVEKHYIQVEKVMKRLAFHDARISFEKSKFGRFKVHFLGWNVSNGFLMADEKRIEKIKQAEFPMTVKGMRSFCGLINSLRICLGFTTLEDVKVLTPLTSSMAKYEPNHKHREAFESLKTKITEAPIYSKLLDPSARKILFTDASTSSTSGGYACVLAQIREYRDDVIHIPLNLTMSDPVHRIIFEQKLKCIPVKLIKTEQDLEHKKIELYKEHPVDEKYLDQEYLGYTEKEVSDSLFISTRSIQHISKCKISTSEELRLLCIKQIKKSIIGLKIADFVFQNNKANYRQFLED